ncbi:hypothetical protein [Dactylosporangium sp. CA-139066]|uniref:hypothetical protein n=1 Tax=Dactylosporangium sp. CA-139066 TaxID=3239930 RepID=UPI003D903331
MPRILVLLLFPLLAVFLVPGTAHAHPLGNFSVNQLAELSFTPSRVDVTATVDYAELPTLQQPGLDAARECAVFAAAFTLRAGATPVAWTVSSPFLTYSDGAAGLRTSRLSCSLSAPFTATTADVANHYRDDRVGWRELTATADGVHLESSPLPTASRTDGLRRYPDDLLSSPPDVRTAHLSLAPGGATRPTDAAAPASALPGFLSRAETRLRGWVGDRSLTPWVGFLAVLLAALLGGAHAALPGHGKTVMAAYLAGRQGRPRDALAVGATVTLTHTGGVLILGLLLTTAAGLAGETVLGWLGVVSGLLVAAVGVAMLRRRHPTHSHSHSHSAPAPAPASASAPAPASASASAPAPASAGGHGHSHSHGEGHSHSHGGEGHAHSHGEGRPSRLALIGMGVAGGLVPSPSALVVLLGAIGLGRTWFGVLLVLAYGAGMAAVLTAAGLLLIRLRDRWPTRWRLPRLTRFAPTGTAALVLLVGSALAVRSFVAL